VALFTSSDVAAFRADRLIAAAATWMPGITLSDAFVLQQIQAAEAEIARRLKVFLEPTTVFCPSATDADIAGLAGGAPYAEDPGYDYDPGFFQSDRWGFIILKHQPIISVSSVRFAYPNPTSAIYTFPADWIRLDKRAGHIRMVPASAAFAAPLNAFLMQALSAGSTIPFMIQVNYVAGLQNVRSDPQWADLVDVILKQAALNILEGSYLPQSGSISADGLSQSLSMNPDSYREMIDRKLMGPKGSNGGLWTSIHGITSGALGTFA
jgi:hypothetical protein